MIIDMSLLTNEELQLLISSHGNVGTKKEDSNIVEIVAATEYLERLSYMQATSPQRDGKEAIDAALAKLSRMYLGGFINN